ncbi:hypothetical protein CBR_g48051 [Chara braunii]|uniref:isochorismate synthase n=1 Tax=Chara braunii TaxID=69332 RepID=A0A388M276_CHABU|nr:hypothetical protein CBR_g48051 [Chara braunii]|eukprot:GBG88582.1 hypothetical protein CBR_g48051 [Chara braunii]
MRAWETIKSTHTPDEAAWHDTVQEMLQAIQEKQSSEDLTTSLSPLEALTQLVQSGFSNVDSMPLTKVVMARQTALTLEDAVDPFLLLELMKHKDPSAYQFCIQVPSGKAFMGSTPERLFVRENLACTSEAVAATRAVTGNDKEDLELALEFLFSQKDHNEFAIVRETVRSSMERVCKSVSVEEHKKVLKQEWVQHLYGRLNGTLHDKQGEFKLLMELHPTAAVCGHPKHVAFQSIQESEPFDRGMFAGPVGYFGGYRTEFAVGIRSALIVNGLVTTLDESNQSTYELQDISQAQETAEHDDHSVNSAKIASNASQEPQASVADGSTSKDKGNQAILYAGVGVVQGSDAASEWKELDLKISQFQALLAPVRPLEDSVNVNELWARMIIEECVRLGITYFCISPGSRSTPLAAAAISHPHVNSIICIDERSLAFHAIGYGRARNIPAVVIVTSGTAVANLYPAVGPRRWGTSSSDSHQPIVFFQLIFISDVSLNASIALTNTLNDEFEALMRTVRSSANIITVGNYKW